jgi:hypothetical protein
VTYPPDMIIYVVWNAPGGYSPFKIIAASDRDLALVGRLSGTCRGKGFTVGEADVLTSERAEGTGGDVVPICAAPWALVALPSSTRPGEAMTERNVNYLARSCLASGVTG